MGVKMNIKQIQGRFGEEETARYLEYLGYYIICRNFRCIQGEIDIIAKDDNELVFIEVKTRSSKKYGEAKEAVDKRKQEHIRNAASYFLYKNNIEKVRVRIDVIEVYTMSGKIEINHIKQAFE